MHNKVVFGDRLFENNIWRLRRFRLCLYQSGCKCISFPHIQVCGVIHIVVIKTITILLFQKRRYGYYYIFQINRHKVWSRFSNGFYGWDNGSLCIFRFLMVCIHNHNTFTFVCSCYCDFWIVLNFCQRLLLSLVEIRFWSPVPRHCLCLFNINTGQAGLQLSACLAAFHASHRSLCIWTEWADLYTTADTTCS